MWTDAATRRRSTCSGRRAPPGVDETSSPCARTRGLLGGRRRREASSSSVPSRSLSRPRRPASQSVSVSAPAASGRRSRPGRRGRSADGQQVGVGPQRVARRRAAALGHGRPQRRRLAQPPGPQLQPDERGERLLGRPAGGPAAADRLAQRGRATAGVAEQARVDDGVDPALDERQRGLEPGQRRLLRRGRLDLEQPLAHRALHRLGVGRVDRADRPLDRGRVDLDAAGVRVDRVEQVAPAATARRRTAAGAPARAARRRAAPRRPAPRARR